MLGVISSVRSIIDTITINIWTGGTSLPSQCQIAGVGVLRKQAGNEDQCRSEPEASEKPRKTMEVMVNAVVLSTDRAHRGIRHAKKTHLNRRPTAIEMNFNRLLADLQVS